MSADTRPRLIETGGRMRMSFRQWRGHRPFWGGLLTLLSGIPIMYVPYANLTIGSLTFSLATTAGAGSLIIGVLLVVLGLTLWFQPASRVFAGVAAILLSLVSLVISNFGGLVIGYLMGLIGGALGVAWAPGKASAEARGEAGEPARPAGGPGSGAEPAAAAAGPGPGHVPDGPPGASPADGGNGGHRAG
ncbi:DUF6114 domain-containing protein [Streptomyces sp. x-80]|jgi:hypothetical protein|uniref:DUF6114 domain-containing protein n=1 Tax=Streptomyces sp. x-80 TaxID=2789282 RepID=UPI0039814B6D